MTKRTIPELRIRKVSLEEITFYGLNVLGIGRTDKKQTITTDPVNGVLNTLISSGEVNLIQPDSLKYAITNWKDAANSYLSHETAFMEMITRLWHFGQDHFPGWDWTDYSEKQRAVIILKKVNTIPYRQRFNAYYQNLLGLIKRHDKIEADINGLLQKIDLRILELENKQ